jgi:hypothetical protein
VLIILLLEHRGFRSLEALVIVLIGTIAGLFGIEIVLSRPEFGPILHNLLVPSSQLLTNSEMLYIGISILGATVMPHNLYLHSSLVQTRDYPRTSAGKREAIRFANIDSATALTMALFVNAAILVVAAAVGGNRGECHFRDCVAGLRAELDPHGHAGRSGGHGGLPQHPPAAVAAEDDYASACHYSYGDRSGDLWGARDGASADLEPGDSQYAVEFRGLSAGDVHQQSRQDGRIRQFMGAARFGMDRGGYDRGAERMAAGPDISRPVKL